LVLLLSQFRVDISSAGLEVLGPWLVHATHFWSIDVFRRPGSSEPLAVDAHSFTSHTDPTGSEWPAYLGFLLGMCDE